MGDYASLIEFVLSAVAFIGAAFFAYNAGKNTIKKEVAKNDLKIKKEQEAIATNGTDSIDELQHGKF